MNPASEIKPTQPLLSHPSEGSSESSVTTAFGRTIDSHPPSEQTASLPKGFAPIVFPKPSIENPLFAKVFTTTNVRSEIIKYLSLTDVISLENALQSAKKDRLYEDTSNEIQLYGYDLLPEWGARQKIQPLDSSVWEESAFVKLYPQDDGNSRKDPFGVFPKKLSDWQKPPSGIAYEIKVLAKNKNRYLEDMETHAGKGWEKNEGWDPIEFKDSTLISYTASDKEAWSWQLVGKYKNLGIFRIAMLKVYCDEKNDGGRGALTIYSDWGSLIDSLTDADVVGFIEGLADKDIAKFLLHRFPIMTELKAELKSMLTGSGLVE